MKNNGIITEQQIDIILKGIENGYTIKECCIELLGFKDNSSFYKNATKEQKDLVIAHKFLYANVDASYQRIRTRLKKSLQ